MPPRTALIELATRRNGYICRSCSRNLGAQQPPRQNFIRCYAGKSKWNDASSVISTTASNGPTKERADKGFTVNYFEEDATGRVQRLPAGEDDDSGDVDIEDIKALEASAMAKVEKLDATLQRLSEKSQWLEGLLAKRGPEGAVEAFRKMMDSFGEEHPEEDDGGEIPQLVVDSSTANVKTNHTRLVRLNNQVRLLNKWLKLSAKAMKRDKVTGELISKTWKFFSQASPLILDPRISVPQKVWDTLWAIFSWEGEENPSRMARIYALSSLMVQAGVPLSDEQQLLALEAKFTEGHESDAIESWKRSVSALGDKESVAIAFWGLGIRMFSQQGDIERAERASKALLDRATPSTPADSRVLLHLIRAYASKPETAEKGFQLYRRMKELAAELGKPLEIEDYDDTISVFLVTGHTDHAMYAFADMMYAGTVNLYGKSKLPTSIRNLFFFGKWLKRLIGAGNLDGAYGVLVYMQKNGVMAAPVQVNGLIGAWLRSRTAENREKADRLASAMIKARKAFVELRRREHLTEWPLRLYDGRPKNEAYEGENLDYTMVPRATRETFILMAGNYRERGHFGKLEELFVSYKECEMGGDARMMNELIAAALDQKRADTAQELYRMMVHEYDVLPNADTYALLFKSLPINRMRGLSVNPAVVEHSIAQARSIFGDMMAASWMYQEGWRARGGGLSEAQAKLVLHSFRKNGDYVGFIAALEGLRDVMQFQITRNVLLEMIAETEHIDRPSARTSKVVVRTTRLLHGLVESMQKKRGERGLETNPEGVRDPRILYAILLEYWQPKAQKKYQEEFGRMLDEAKREMGVEFARQPPPQSTGSRSGKTPSKK